MSDFFAYLTGIFIGVFLSFLLLIFDVIDGFAQSFLATLCLSLLFAMICLFINGELKHRKKRS